MQYLLKISNSQITAVILLSLFSLIGFILSPAISNDNFLEKNDIFLFEKISNLHNFFPNYFTEFMIVVTNFGRELFWPIVIGLLFLFGNKIMRKKIIMVSVIIVIVILLTSISKSIVERERPTVEGQKLIYQDNYSNSYPSGHTSVVTAGAVLAILVLQNSSKRLLISILLITEAVLVSFSRIYVGLHYSLDVVGGAMLGIGVSLLLMNSNKIKKILKIP
ncbi:MAG: hypothetical protein DA328_06255 [Nitrososphaeraceae archaeon]|nr:hypothetical protein [Nitrososphaeraceae archaeon]